MINWIHVVTWTAFLYLVMDAVSITIDKYGGEFYHEHLSLLDLGHWALPDGSRCIFERLPNLISVAAVASILASPLYTGSYRILRDFIGLGIAVFFLRALTTAVTILPKHKSCDPNSQLTIFGRCYDKIFSGHFAIVLLATILLREYGALSNFWVVAINALNAVSILVARHHYTIDVITAFFVTMFVVQNRVCVLNIK